MTMTSAQQLSNILIAEENSAAQLLSLLKAERDALTASDMEVIDKMTAEKQPLVIKLEQIGRQREGLLKQQGFPAGKAGLDAFIANQSAQVASALKVLVTKLRTTAYACKEFNQVNGGIVNVNRQYLQKAMSILRGRDATASSYGPGGEYSNQVVQQPLIGRV